MNFIVSLVLAQANLVEAFSTISPIINLLVAGLGFYLIRSINQNDQLFKKLSEDTASIKLVVTRMETQHEMHRDILRDVIAREEKLREVVAELRERVNRMEHKMGSLVP